MGAKAAIVVVAAHDSVDWLAEGSGQASCQVGEEVRDLPAFHAEDQEADGVDGAVGDQDEDLAADGAESVENGEANEEDDVTNVVGVDEEAVEVRDVVPYAADEEGLEGAVADDAAHAAVVAVANASAAEDDVESGDDDEGAKSVTA